MKSVEEKATRSAQWRRLEVAVDSGACENAVDLDELLEHDIKETRESNAKENLVSATGKTFRIWASWE